MTDRLRFVLVSPQIAANVGNITRTATALGAEIHLVRPFGFFLNHKDLKRGSVGYWESQVPEIYRDSEDFWSRFPVTEQTQLIFATKGGDEIHYEVSYGSDVVLFFGSEDEGIPENFWQFKGLNTIRSCRIPMQQVRCLNLATAVGIMGYEVFRQRHSRNTGIMVNPEAEKAMRL